MKAIILATAAALIALPVAAQVPAGAAGAIAHFNQDIDTPNNRASVVEGASAGLATRSGVNEAQIRFNADFDTQDNIRKTSGATVAAGSPSRDGDIFARIRAEGLEDE